MGSASARPLVYLVAPSGFPNYGDELIARTWLRELAARAPDADVVLDCHTPGTAAVLLAGSHPRLTVVDTLWHLALSVTHVPPDDAITHVQTVIANPGIDARRVHGIRLATRADVVHLLGGGYVNAIWPHHLVLLAAAHATAKAAGARLVATGQGLAPVGDAQWLHQLRDLVSGFDVFDVRDGESLDAVGTDITATRLGGDDAWLALRSSGDLYAKSDDETPEFDVTRRRFVFLLQSDLMSGPDGSESIDWLEQALRDLVTRWGIRGEDAAFVEGIPGGDRVIFDRCADILGGAVFCAFEQLWDNGFPAVSDQVWVTTRFHFHLLAAAAGASGVFVPGRADYYPVKHRSLIDAGSRWVSLDQAGPRPPSRGGFGAIAKRRNIARKMAVADAVYSDLFYGRSGGRSPLRRSWATGRK